ncbi:MAG: tetratricopeptide repeat protein [Sulfurifustis sp.]
MAQSGHEHLDSQELLHLALDASRRHKHEDAITLLKRALAIAPDDARLHYLLGAEHAQIGLYDRAAEEMQNAVHLDPKLETAHFQLGLLHVTSGRVEQAAEAWKPLDKLGPDHPLYLFKTGLLHLSKDEFSECERNLRRGIGANKANPALNNDMQRILREIENQAPGEKSETSAAAEISRPKTTTPKHVLLSAYKRNRPDDKES